MPKAERSTGKPSQQGRPQAMGAQERSASMWRAAIEERKFNALATGVLQWIGPETLQQPPIVRAPEAERILRLVEDARETMLQPYERVIVAKLDMEEQQAWGDQAVKDVTVIDHEISEMIVELEQAKDLRRRNEKYDSMAAKIMQLPDRATSKKRLEDLQVEIDKLTQEGQELDRQLELKRKQFLPVVGIGQLLCASQPNTQPMETTEDGNR